MPGTMVKRLGLLLLCVQLSTTLPLHHAGLHYLQELTHLHSSASVGMQLTNPYLVAICTSKSPMFLGALLNTVTETLFWRCSAASARTGWKLCTLWHWTLKPCNHNELVPINGGSHMSTTPSSINKQQPGVHQVQLPVIDV